MTKVITEIIKSARTRMLFIIYTLLVCVAIVAAQYSKVNAWNAGQTQPLSSCLPTGLDKWDWPKAIREIPNRPELVNFNAESSSFIIWQVSNGWNATGAQYPQIRELVIATNGGKLRLETVNGETQATSIGGGRINVNLNSSLKEQYGGTADTKIATWSNYDYSTPANTNTWTGTLPNNAGVAGNYVHCIDTARNVTYDVNYTGATFKSTASYGSESCGLTNIGCWIAKAYDGFTDTFAGVVRGILQGLAFLFAPDSAKTTAQFNDLNVFMSEKLGFLIFPLTFFTNVWQAFGSTANDWCTSTTCTKNFGNLFGRPYTMNLLQGKITYPTLWNWFIAIVRGATVMALVFGIRRKIMEVMHR